MARRDEVDQLVARWLDLDPDRPHAPDSLPLALPPFGRAEIAEAIDTLLSGWVTMGPKVRAFEEAWARYIGVRHAVMVNSGSSALLVMLSALVETGVLRRGDEVLVPAVGWSTSLFSVAQAGLVPVVVDVDPDTLCLEGSYDRPVLAIHMLGAASGARSPLLLEDACGAHGAEVDGVRVGARGRMGVFSFFFSHHLSTGEGGAITTDDDALADACRSLRAHGWTRERSDRGDLEAQHPELDTRFLFVTTGFNLRPPEVAGAMGMHQVPRLAAFAARRRANHVDWCARIGAAGLPLRIFPERAGTRHAGFGFPILLEAHAPLTRAALCARLEARGIQTRPISGGNLAAQPAFAAVPGARVEGALPVADAVHQRGFFVGNSHAFTEAHGALLLQALEGALA